MLEKFVATLRKILGIEPSVDRIVKPLTKMQTKLAKHEAAQQSAAARDREIASKIVERASAEEAEAARAKAAAEKVGALFNF